MASALMTAARVVIAVAGLSAVSRLRANGEELTIAADSLEHVKVVSADFEANGQFVTSHLFAHHSDLVAQDRDARSVNARKAAITKAVDELRRLHPDDRALLDRLAAVRGQYVSIFGRAIERSGAETVAGAASRSGSRSMYNKQLLSARERLDAVLGETVKKITADVALAETHIVASSAEDLAVGAHHASY